MRIEEPGWKVWHVGDRSFRGGKNYWPGGFPRGIEKEIWEMVGRPKKVFHSFGGRAEIGFRLDFQMKAKPDILGDAHKLPIKSGSFDCVFLDPPYSAKLNKRLYGVKKALQPKKFFSEAYRILKPGGILVWYHWWKTSFRTVFNLEQKTSVVLLQNPGKRPRVVQIFKKKGFLIDGFQQGDFFSG